MRQAKPRRRAKPAPRSKQTNPQPSRDAENIALDAWANGETGPGCVSLVAKFGETISPGQMTAIIHRAKEREDPRAVKHNLYATIVRAS